MYTASMKIDTTEQEQIYVLRQPGSLPLELPMTPSMARRINADRKKRGFFDGDWEPQSSEDCGMWHLDFNLMPDWMFNLLKKAQQPDFLSEECDS